MRSAKTYYVYELFSSLTGEVFYVGKGTGDRMHVHELEAKRGGTYQGYRTNKIAIIRGIWQSGGTVQKRIVFETDDEQEALERERQLITLRSTTLANVMHNTHVNPIGRLPRLSSSALSKGRALSTAEKIQQEKFQRAFEVAFERAQWLNRSLVQNYPEYEHERLLTQWNERASARLHFIIFHSEEYWQRIRARAVKYEEEQERNRDDHDIHTRTT